MKPTKLLILISVFSVVPSVHARFMPLSDSDLSNQALYSSGAITMGAGTTVGGNIQSDAAITLGANATVGGNVEAGAAVTLGADAGVGGYIQAEAAVTLGANSMLGGYIRAGAAIDIGALAEIKGNVIGGDPAIATAAVTIGADTRVDGYIQARSAVTLGANSIIGGDVDAGTTIAEGAGAQIAGVSTQYSSKVLPPPPAVKNQRELIESVQKELRELGTATLLPAPFGTNDETLEAGIYSPLNYLAIAAGKTLTLDGKGVDGSWVFNIPNYLSFAADAKVVLKDVTDNSSIIWNIQNGYTSLGARAEVTGYIFAYSYVLTGANSLITGVGDSCGGVFSATNYITFGADNVIGEEGCVSDPTTENPPSIIWLY
ncbi:ice-binding family protein [Neptunomonas antarctica]|uniref:Polymer-forming protein n=1 Tax=Neptunomonas antarctica TaxID=619304 RepID=A0A1N7IZQ2_9GAMM|nr:ice-binding family protein [Neptunomonas antarctica]SIS42583.1 Protein of unknown function [Neptunomonas antarctica]